MLPQIRVPLKFNLKMSLLAFLMIALFPNSNISDGGKFDISDRRKYEGPGRALIHYLEASYLSRFDVAYQQLSSKDKKNLSLSKYIHQRKGIRTHGRLFPSTHSYQIVSLHSKKSTAEVAVKIQKKSQLNELSKFFDSILESMIGVKKHRIPEEHFGPHMNTETPLRGSIKKYKLLKENGSWKVFLGLREKNV